MSLLEVLNYCGLFVFSISGMLAASEKRLDLFGGYIIAFVTALGGGTLRDVLLNVDIAWIEDPNYLYCAFAGGTVALVFKKKGKQIRKTLFLFDTIGIALFTILGIQKALAFDSPQVVAVIFGVMSATFGGVIRDILCNEIPLLFRQEIYATACIIGAAIYLVCFGYGAPEWVTIIVSGGVIIGIRTLAVLKGLRMPLLNDKL